MAGKGGEALLALLAPKKGGMGDDESTEKPEGEHEQAARDFFEAGKRGDWAAAGEALETVVLNCMSKYGPEKTETEE
jgi:hypothetical protein